MIITSIYVADKGQGSAVCSFFIKHGTVAPIGELWESGEKNGYNYLVAALNHDWRTERFIINPGKDPSSPAKSRTKAYLNTDGHSVTIADPFYPDEGMATFELLKYREGFFPDMFYAWPKVDKLLKKIHEDCPPVVMTFLQGMIEAEKEATGRSPFLHAIMKDGNDVSGGGMPTSQWATGTLKTSFMESVKLYSKEP